MDLYDEFGNYIGPELHEDEVEDHELSAADSDDDLDGRRLSDEEGDTDHKRTAATGGDSKATDGRSAVKDMSDEPLGVTERAVVPFEEKKYYPGADTVYPNAETIVQDEDTQPLTEPIVAPVRTKKFDILDSTLPSTYSLEFLSGMMYKPDMMRSICLLGGMHHGKTLLMDVLVKQTHDFEGSSGNVPSKKSGKMLSAKTAKSAFAKEMKYTDTRVDEQARGVSIKSVPMTLVLPDSREKSYLINIFDTPGHSDFSDECTAAIRLCDGAVIVVDALEGIMTAAENLIRHAVKEKLKVVLFINCIDRLVLELRLPPVDAYHKLRHSIEEVNTILESAATLYGLDAAELTVSPLKGNVAFGSGQFGSVFTLASFAKIYSDTHGGSFDPTVFAKCLWGDVYQQPDGSFGKALNGETPRSFVQYILTPFYKLVAHCASSEQDDLEPLLAEIGIFLRKQDYLLNTKALLKKALSAFFGDVSALVDVVVTHLPSPKENSVRKVEHIYTGDHTSKVARDMKTLNKDGVLMVHTSKNYHRPDCATFDLFGRVMSGTIHKGQRVRVLGEAFSLDDDEDMAIREVTNLWIYEGRYRIEVSHVPAGNWCLIAGVETGISKTATITDMESTNEEVEIFSPLKFDQTAVIKIAAEPLNPSELPKMLEGLRRIDRAYPLVTTKVEDNGEHVILGTGELYMDCLLHDLRKLYGDLEIKVADPVVQFCETVVETSALKCFAETLNKKNKLHMICGPLEKGIAEDLDSGLIGFNWDQRRLGDYFVQKYDWDVLAARSIWSFGPDHRGSNVLVDDTLPTDVDKNLLTSSKNFIVQGFQWAVKEGPLVEENIRNCKFKILDASLAKDPINRGGGQIIPTARRLAYSTFLLATPRLMEPMLFTEIQCPADCIQAVYTILSRRRGHVARDIPKPGSPLYAVHAYIPAIESFGFDTDLRAHTNGQAFCMTRFDSWSIVPGDPLDKSIVLRPLEPAATPHLAREFLLKTRRRKGLSEDVSVNKFFDDSMLVELARQDADLQQYF
eukprot:Lankesteria_metandrocarpae@DN4626_c0_g1_i1.p1